MSPRTTDPTTGINGALAAEIRAEMGVQNIGTPDLAERSTLAYRTLIRLVKMERVIDVDQLNLIGEGLGVPAEELLARAAARLARTASSWTLAADEERVSPEDEAQAVIDSE